jgi:sugar phosphate isomerase/epimerase
LSYLFFARDLRLFFEGYGWEQIGIGYDFANGHFAGEAPVEMLQLRDHLTFVYAADTSPEVFRHAQVGTGTVAYESIAATLRRANVHSPTILEIVAADAQRAIDASVDHLDSIQWPAN